MRSSDKESLGTPISYAARNSKGVVDDNALHLTDYSNFNLGINNESQSLEMDANDGEWHHIAVTWSSSNGLWKAYKDGVVVNKNRYRVQLIVVLYIKTSFIQNFYLSGLSTIFNFLPIFIGETFVRK